MGSVLYTSEAQVVAASGLEFGGQRQFPLHSADVSTPFDVGQFSVQSRVKQKIER